MRCLNPRTVGFQADGKTIAWSQKSYSKQYATFQLPCGKCIDCRLEYGRQNAVRCVHEAKMYENNCFITLTYEKVTNPKLQYRDFQLFLKRLRKKIYIDFINSYGLENWKLLSKTEQKETYAQVQIGFFATGEYGEITKRPHWHALIFNWRPTDSKLKYTNSRGDQIFSSDDLHNLWGHGIAEFGSVTFESAGYCARYAAKKLCHGRDGEHDFHPIHKRSTRSAIGKKFLEKYWPDIFTHGQIILDSGQKTSVPRYYEKWLQKHEPEAWVRYVTQTKLKKTQTASQQTEKEYKQWLETLHQQRINNPLHPNPPTQNQNRKEILDQKFAQLQRHLKNF